MKVAFSSLNINPLDKKPALAGFINRGSAKNNCILGENSLHVKVIWLKDKSFNLLFISVDTLYISETLYNTILSFVESKYGIHKQSIIINASHTHSAPNISYKTFGEINASYQKNMIEKIKKALAECSKNFQNCFISSSVINKDHNLFIYRRKLIRDIKTLCLRKKIHMLPNSEKEIDTSIKLLKIYNQAKELVAVIYSFSCHPVFNRSQHISSDFIGSISNKIELKRPIFTMFLQGFSGDIRPNYRLHQQDISLWSKFKSKQHFKLLLSKEVFKTYDKSFFNVFVDKISHLILDELDKNPTFESTMAAKLMTKELNVILESNTKKTKKTMSILICKLNQSLFISIPAEVTSSYFEIINNNISKTLHLFGLGCTNGMLGYLPGVHDLKEGGYEVTSLVNYNWDSPFSIKSIQTLNKSLIKTLNEMKHDYQA